MRTTLLPAFFPGAARGFLLAAALALPTVTRAAVAVQCLTESIGDVEMSSPVAGAVAIIHYDAPNQEHPEE